MKTSLSYIESPFFWSDKTRIHLFGSDGTQHVWREICQDYQSEYIVLTVKNRGGSVLIWGCMSAKVVGKMTFIDGAMMNAY